MKERGIVFTASSVRGIQSDDKTQTRRTVKVQPPADTHSVVYHRDHWRWVDTDPGLNDASFVGEPFDCPFGRLGDGLWVREAWCPGRGLAAVASREILMSPSGAALAPGIIYRADGATLPTGLSWRSPLFMPRWASRILLELTDVRVQRVQEISEEDAIAEGMLHHDGNGVGHSGWRHDREFGQVSATAVGAYLVLWNLINGKRAPWSENPWTWALGFRRIE